jgi:aspartate aminotransferase-like enzyme
VAAGAQAGLEGLGLTLVAPPGHRSATVTAAWLPEGMAWTELGAWLREHGLVLAGGQGKWTGRILRMGHMGDVTFGEIADAVSTLGAGLSHHGHSCNVEAAVAAGWAAHDRAAAVVGSA